MKKVEASCEDYICPQCGDGCNCFPEIGIFECISGIHKEAVKKIGEHPNLCESHVECKNKGSGNFCGRFPNHDVEYGWCFASKYEAEEFTTKSKLKMSVSA